MKKILLLSLLALSAATGFSQVIADPALNQIAITDNATVNLNELQLPQSSIVFLRVPILNLNNVNGLPAGTCKVKIGLGSKLALDPTFDLAATNTSAYFTWTADNSDGQVQLTGDLIADLPAGYNVTVFFRVAGTILGNSTITTNFLVTNHNSPVNLSDENPANNTSFLPYTVIAPIPVNFTGIAARKEDCSIRVNFGAEGEINVARYEIEASRDGIQYTKMGQLPANRSINYQYLFPITDAIKAPLLYIRVKSVDLDGRTQYTEVRTVRGSCEENGNIILFPNPLPQEKQEVTIKTTKGLFNGRIVLTLLDIAGRVIRSQTITLANVQQFGYPTGHLAAGQYLLKLQEQTTETPVVLRFQKN